MTLDPAARRFLDEAAVAAGPRTEDVPLDEARRRSAELVAALTPPGPEVAMVEHLEIGDRPATLWSPAAGDAAASLPVLVDVHGGGFVLGSVHEQEPLSRARAVAAGVRVVAPEYRLAPEDPWPAALDDVCAVLKWAGSLGVPFAACGDSAGGNLVAAACLRLRDGGRPLPALMVLLYPALDARAASASYAALGDGYLLEASTMRWFWSQYLSGGADPDDPLVSPARAGDLGGLPPALVITAEYDPLRDEGEAFADRLRMAGGDAVTSRYQGMLHGFAAFGRIFPAAARALEEVATAVAAAVTTRTR